MNPAGWPKRYAGWSSCFRREAGGKWISFAMMNKPVEALEQSFLRTKQSDYASYIKVAALQASGDGNIALQIFAADFGLPGHLDDDGLTRAMRSRATSM